MDAPPPPFAIPGVTIHTGTGEVIEDGTVLVVDGKIAAVGKSIALPARGRR